MVIRRQGRQHGFTLMEVVVSLTVLGVGVAIAMQLIVASIKQVRTIGNHVTAAQYADAVMNDLLLRDDVDHPGELAEALNDTYRWHAVMDEVIDPPVPLPGMPPGMPPPEPPVKKITIDLTIYWRNRFSESSMKLFTIKLVPNDRLGPGGAIGGRLPGRPAGPGR